MIGYRQADANHSHWLTIFIISGKGPAKVSCAWQRAHLGRSALYDVNRDRGLAK